MNEFETREQQRRERERPDVIIAALLAAIALHALVLTQLTGLGPAAPIPKKRSVTLVPMNAQQLAANRTRQSARAKADPQLAKELREVPEQKRPEDQELTEEEKKDAEGKQVVDIAPPLDQRAPDKTDHLAEFNSRVEKETRSRFQVRDYMQPAPVPRMGERQDRPAQEIAAPQNPDVAARDPSQTQGEAREAAEASRKRTDAAQERQRMSEARRELSPELKLRFDPFGDIATSKGLKRKRDGDGERTERAAEASEAGGDGDVDRDAVAAGGRSIPRHINLNPSPQALAMVAGAPSNDYLPRVDESDTMQLNAKQFRFASFFNRVKRQISQHWSPGSVYQARDPQGNIYGYRDRLTVLNVTLNTKGEIVRMNVEQSSGVDFLDAEAMRAFEVAQPFSNPPRGLIEGDEVNFSFGFMVEISANPSLNLFRYNAPGQ